MKKIIFVAVIMVLSGFVFTHVDAATSGVIKVSNKTSFGVDLKAVNKIAFTNKSKFDYEITNMVNPVNIDHWKVRVVCAGDIGVGFTQTTPDICGKVIKVPATEMGKNFSMYMTRVEGAKKVGFTLKLKAYDKNGKWLHTEAENVRW